MQKETKRTGVSRHPKSRIQFAPEAHWLLVHYIDGNRQLSAGWQVIKAVWRHIQPHACCKSPWGLPLLLCHRANWQLSIVWLGCFQRIPEQKCTGWRHLCHEQVPPCPTCGQYWSLAFAGFLHLKTFPIRNSNFCPNAVKVLQVYLVQNSESIFLFPRKEADGFFIQSWVLCVLATAEGVESFCIETVGFCEGIKKQSRTTSRC